MKNGFKLLVSIFFILGILCLGFSFGGFFGVCADQVYALDGGAVFLKSGASYTMSGGSIRNKTATYGGAVYVSDDSTFNMNGGTISGNTASVGSGVYVASGGTFNMSGGTMEDEVFTAGSMVYTGGTVSGTITLAGAENLTIGTVPEEPLNVTAQTTDVGTKLIKVTASGFELSDVNISGLPTGRRVILSGGYVVVDYVYYTITWKNADGTVLETDTVAHGTTPTYDGATPTKASTAQYSYAFKSWDSTVVAATASKTYTATYTATTRSYVVTIGVSPSGYGSVDKTSVTVPYGTSISASGATLTVGSNTIKATATAATAQYTYAFSSWTGASGTVTGTKTITANFTRTTNQYTVTLGTGYGSWDTSAAITVDYGTAISVSSNKLTVGSTTRTFTKSGNTDQYTYTFNSLSGVPSGGKVVANVTITPSVTRTTNQYTVTLGSGHGSWDTSTAITVDYGTAISVSSNKLTVGSTTRTFTTSTDTAQYDYTFNSLSGVPSDGKVVGNVTITPNVTRATKSYTLSYSNSYYYATNATDITITASRGTLSRNTINSSNSTFTLTAEYSTSPITITFTRKNTNRNYFVWWNGSDGEVNTVSRTWTPTANESNYWCIRECYKVNAVAGTGISSATFSGTNPFGYNIPVSSSEELLYGSTIKFSASVSTGYTWSKWSDGSTTQTDYAVTTLLDRDIDLTASATINKYTVTLGSSSYGSWDTSAAITVDYGTAISVSSNKLTVGSTTRTFTTSTDTAQYDYTFNSLSGVPSDGKVVGNVTITPNVTRATKSYTVTIAVNNSGYGSVDKTSVTVNYGTSISASGATLTVGSNTIKATATAATAQYTYAFSSWTGASGTVTDTKTITANFTRTTNQYTVTWKNGSTTLETDTGVAYGTTPTYNGATPTKSPTAQYSYTFSGWSPSVGEITGNTTYTAEFIPTIRTYTVKWKNGSTTLETDTGVAYGDTPTYNGATPTKPQDAQYTYTFSGWEPSVGAITGDTTYGAQFTATLRSYTITIAVNTSGYGTVSKTSVTVNYGTSISASGTTLTIGSNTITATPTTATAQYSYAFSGWSNAGTSVTGAKTITANFTQTLRTYTVTWEDGYYNVVEVDYNVPYGTTPTFNGGDLSHDEGDYYAEHDGWYPEIRPVTGDITYEAAYTRSINQYTLTFNISPSSSGYFTDSDGTTYSGNSMSLTVCYGTEYIVSGNQIYLIDNYSGSGFELTIYAHANSGYNFDTWSWDDGSGTIESDESITANFEQSVVYYNIYFVIEGLSDFYRPGYLTDGYVGAYEFSASVREGTRYTISNNYVFIENCGTVYAYASIGYEFWCWNDGDEEGYIDCDMTFYAEFISPENKVTIVAYGAGYVTVEDDVTGAIIAEGPSVTIGVSNGATIEDYGEELLIEGRYHVYVNMIDSSFYGFFAVAGPGVSYDVLDEHRIIYAVFDDYETWWPTTVDINGMHYQFAPGTMIRIYGSGRIDAVRFDQNGTMIYYQSLYPALGLDGQTPVYYYINDNVNGEFETGFYANDNYDGIVMYQFFACETTIEFYT